MFITFTFTITDSSVWQQQLPPFKKYGETGNFRNMSEFSPSFGKVPNSIEVMPGQTVILSCIVNNLGDRTVRFIQQQISCHLFPRLFYIVFDFYFLNSPTPCLFMLFKLYLLSLKYFI